MDENSNMPLPAKVGIGGTAGAGFLGAGYFFAKGGQGFWIFLVVMVVLLLLLLGGYFLWVYLKRRRESAKMSGEMHQQSAASPRGISDPAKRAALDNLRKKFDEGVAAYRSRGKDLYSLPWYVIVGEPGSGKTEAVRHSNVGFPPGMQDEFQGVGGTINMNWWFTNNAVLLDTAGRLMFEEVKPGETSEWREFLNLLKKFRANCPINGLILVIPSESLIKNTSDEIQRKAGKIAQQLDVIQRTLDVRFPVFIIVTKCDLILGFREFFDGVTDPQLQHQIMGWSNPDPLDAPFRADLVDQHIATVVQRLNRRRLGLLRDPVPEADKADARRTDEVDTLYALPNSVAAIVPRLRRYLETIFVAGEWSAKPLFLRGIYFTSSMREGTALDAELAEAMGVPVDDISDFKVWERERSYFLRDLFLEKVFRERGLVTRATSTKGLLRKRKLLLYGCGFAALAIFITVAWLGMTALKGSVKSQSDYWRALADVGWDAKVWNKALIPHRNDGSYLSEMNSVKVEVPGAGRKATLGEFHWALRQAATNFLKSSWRYPGLVTKYNENSLKAQRIAFETSVVKPLVDATRQKLRTDGPLQGEPARAQAEALIALIQLEVGILSRGQGANTGSIDEAGVKAFAAPLLAYVVGPGTSLDTNLVSVWAWLYTRSDAGRSQWPMNWLSGKGSNDIHTLANNAALTAGLNNYVRGLTTSLTAQRDGWKEMSELQELLRAHKKLEDALLQQVKMPTVNDSAAKMALDAVLTSKKKLTDWIDDKRLKSPMLAEGVSLTNAFTIFRRTVTGSAAGALDRLQAANQLALLQHTNFPLFLDLRTRLAQVAAEINKQVAELVPEAALDEMRQLDADFLAKTGPTGVPAFAARCELYTSTEQLVQKSMAVPWKPGLKGKPLEDYLASDLAPVRATCAAYTAGAKDTLASVTGYYLARAEQRKAAEYFDNYLLKAKAELTAKVGFPLAQDGTRKMSFKEIDDFSTVLKFIADDLKAPVFVKYGVDKKDDWTAFNGAVSRFASLAGAILGPDNTQGKVSVTLLAMLESMPQGKDAWRGPLRRIRLGAAGERIDTNIAADAPLGSVLVDAPIAVELTSPDNALKVPADVQKTDDWGPLALVLKSGGIQDKADPRSWLIDWPVKDDKYKGDVRIKLTFERPLPDLKTWPTQQF